MSPGGHDANMRTGGSAATDFSLRDPRRGPAITAP